MIKKIILAFLIRGVPAIIVLAGFIGLFNYLVATKPQVASEPAAPQVWTVKDLIVQNQNAQPQETAYGTVEASRKAELRFSVQGEVSWISPALRNGAMVNAGDELVRLDTTRYQLALDELLAQIRGEEAQIASLKKQLDLRQKTLTRTKRMASQNVVSDANLDDAELAVAITESQLIASQSRLSQLKIAERSRRKDISDLVSYSAFHRHVIKGGYWIGANRLFQQRRLPISQINHLLRCRLLLKQKFMHKRLNC